MNRSSTSQFHALRFGVFVLSIGASLLLITSLTVAQEDTATPDAIAIFNNAQDLQENNNLAGAIELYKRALKIDPNFPEAEYQCGVAFLSMHKHADAEQAFRRAVELKPDWTLALTALGSILVQNNNFTEAERVLSRVFDLEPQNAPALVAMADLRLKTKAAPSVFSDLLTKLSDLTSKANPTAAVWSARAALETTLGKRDAAKLSIANALKIDPKNKNTLFQLADMALEDGDLIKAEEAARTLQSLSPNAERLKLLDTKIMVAEGNSSANAAELEKQLESDAKNPIILGRVCAAYRIPNPQKALDYCRRASEAEPSNINHAVGFGAALVQAKQFDGAVNVLRKIIEIAPDNSTAHANLATALFELKRYREAKTEYEWLTTKQPNLSAAYFFLAITHDNLGEYPDAMANYQQYLRIADPVANKLEIEKVNLRLPALQKKIRK